MQSNEAISTTDRSAYQADGNKAVRFYCAKIRKDWQMVKAQTVLKRLELNVKVDLVPERLWAYKCTYKMKPKYITIHNAAFAGGVDPLHLYGSTCCLDPNLQMLKSWHFSVGALLAIQMLPLNRNGWHAGDGAGAGNRQSIGIEIAHDLDYNTDLYYKAEDNAAKLTAFLLWKFGLGVDRVKSHKYWSGKYCPHRMLSEVRWDKFKKKVARYLEIAKKAAQQAEQPDVIILEPIKPEPKKYVYRLQTYPTPYRSEANYRKNQARTAGYKDAFIKVEDGKFRVQLSAHSNWQSARNAAAAARSKGFNTIVRRVEIAPKVQSNYRAAA